MSAITKAAAVILVSGLLTGASATAVFANETAPDGNVTVVDAPDAEAPAPVTQAEVDAAFAVFKQAQADALVAEKLAHVTARAQEAAALQLAKDTKGTAKKAAQDQVHALRAANHLALKELKAANNVTVDAAKAAYQEIAALCETQNTPAA